MRIRSFSIRAFVPAVCFAGCLALTVSTAFSQSAPPAAQTPTAASQRPTLPPQTNKDNDYPDKRTLEFGADLLVPASQSGPDIRGGVPAQQLNTNENLLGLGKLYKYLPRIEAGVPISRTGMLYVDFERYHGTGDQTLPADALINTFNYLKGDQMHSSYHVATGRIYLDDLLYPHKFPVSRLRFRSIWGVRYIGMTEDTISSTRDAVGGAYGYSFNGADHNIILPEFGLAMEYALAPHVLFRVDGAGFGIPHHSDFYETNAFLSVRHSNLEFVGGVRTLDFKTSPQKEEYFRGSFVSPFIGVRWHF